jgi:hypothetical protein
MGCCLGKSPSDRFGLPGMILPVDRSCEDTLTGRIVSELLLSGLVNSEELQVETVENGRAMVHGSFDCSI